MLEHRLAKGLVLLTFSLILLGGIVHGTDSSLACPDWPLCYGQIMPAMKGNVAIEHGHRLLAAAVGLLTILLAGLLWRRRPELKWMGVGAVGLVIFQGILGGLTVIYRLPTLVSTAHLGISMIFFGLLIVIACKAKPFNPLPPAGEGGPERVPLTGGTSRRGVRANRFLKALAVLLYLEILLGALVRHTGAGLLCPDIPFCYGSLWPVDSWARQLHMAHRYVSILLAGGMIPLPFLYWDKVLRRHRPVLILIPLLVMLQIGVGILSLRTLLGLSAITLHLGLATLMWGLIVWLWQRNRTIEGET